MDSRIKVVAEERRVGEHSGEALAEMRKKRHARHSIRSEIQKVEAVCVHDIIEEIGERGAKAAGKVIDEKWVPIRAGLGEISEDGTRGRMPRRLSPRLAPPQGLEVVLEVDRVDRRGKVGELRPPRRRLTIRGLRPPTSLATPLPLLVLGAMAAARGEAGRAAKMRRQQARARA